MATTKTNSPVPKGVEGITKGTTAKIGMTGNTKDAMSSTGGQRSHMPSRDSYSGRMNSASVKPGVSENEMPSGRLSNKSKDIMYDHMPKPKK